MRPPPGLPATNGGIGAGRGRGDADSGERREAGVSRMTGIPIDLDRLVKNARIATGGILLFRRRFAGMDAINATGAGLCLILRSDVPHAKVPSRIADNPLPPPRPDKSSFLSAVSTRPVRTFRCNKSARAS